MHVLLTLESSFSVQSAFHTKLFQGIEPRPLPPPPPPQRRVALGVRGLHDADFGRVDSDSDVSIGGLFDSAASDVVVEEDPEVAKMREEARKAAREAREKKRKVSC